MNKQELIDDAKRAVKSYIERELEARNEKMVYPVVAIKLDHDPEGEWDGVNNAILVSKDEKAGNIHLYCMTCIMHKEVVEQMFDIKINDFVGHIVIDNEEKHEKLLKIVKEEFNLDSLRKKKKDKAEKKKMRFPGWDSI